MFIYFVSYNTEPTSGNRLNKADNDVNGYFDTAWGVQHLIGAGCTSCFDWYVKQFFAWKQIKK